MSEKNTPEPSEPSNLPEKHAIEDIALSETDTHTELTPEEKNWAMFAHLSSFSGLIGIPLGSIIAPLIIWQMKKEDMPFAAEQAKESLNFQLSMLIYIIIAGILCIILIGFLLLFLIIISDIIFTIIAAINASNGKKYRYPMTIRLIK